VCGKYHVSASLSKKDQDKINKRAKDIAKLIYTGKFKDDIDTELTILIAKKLTEAVVNGFGNDLLDIAYNTPDWNMLANLEKNVYQFSAAKNYQSLKDITLALKDQDGNIRSFKDFRDTANKISYQYNTEWLQTEYNTAIGCGQMAGRWVEFQQNAESMPYLQYVTAGDDRVREEHALLDGMIKHINDPFWDVYYPPNGYNCRCDVIQLPGDAEQTDTDNLKMPGIPELFQTNTGKQELVFSDKHPYFKGVPDTVITKADKISTSIIEDVKKKSNES
jgi:SPP1 gp7 family putative phage head morphogenesis protein